MPDETEDITPLEVDATSDKRVLVYVGDGTRSARNAPPHDLTGGDLARLAYIERVREIGNDVGQPIDRDDPEGARFERPDPRNPDPELVGAIVADLVASEQFARPRAKAAKEKDAATEKVAAETPDTTNAPAEPAEKPEA